MVPFPVCPSQTDEVRIKSKGNINVKNGAAASVVPTLAQRTRKDGAPTFQSVSKINIKGNVKGSG
jgi:hypothetical protein